ncbi:MAG: peptidase [Gemmatimonadetes bacterium]|nr:peptidase [Gemmatimonadota bacterium]
MMTVRASAAALAGVALAACACRLAAQAPGPQPIAVGARVQATLVPADPTANERGRFKAFRFAGRRGQRLSLLMHSTEFDSYLSVGRTVQGITDYLKNDDDSGGNNDARLRFTVPADGPYVVLAQSLTAEGTGAFTLSMDTLPTPIITPPVAMQLGRLAAGTLAETDPTLESDGSHYDLYTFNARRGQRLQVTMKSSDFDAYLGWGSLKNGEFEAAESDDDGGGGTDARVRVTVPADGPYVIRANSVGAGRTGAYSLLVEERAPLPPAPAPAPIRIGQVVSGTLDDRDPQADDDAFYDLYRFAGHAGDKVTITMRADSFDTFVALGRLDNGQFTEMETADDGADGTNSKLEITLTGEGEYAVRATSLFGNTRGAYTILVESTR